MRRIKRLIGLVIAVMIGGALVSYLSIQGEKEHQENCEKLGVVCEKGRMHELNEIGRAHV